MENSHIGTAGFAVDPIYKKMEPTGKVDSIFILSTGSTPMVEYILFLNFHPSEGSKPSDR